MPRVVLRAALLVLFVSCSPDEPSSVRHALYEWRSSVRLADSAARAFDSLGVDRLYVRFFDVQWEAANGAVPRSTARFAGAIPESVDVIPTVYITNRTMLQVSGDGIDSLAQRILQKIESMIEDIRSNRSAAPFPEIQIDCDWTAATRSNYFDLLKSLDERLPERTIVSATIRLHQVRYRRETGVPPVDRGMLMVYNTGEVTSLEEVNSIVSKQAVEQYVENLESYPLPLDVALPIFSWGVRFHLDRFASIIPEVTTGDLARERTYRQIASNRFRVLSKTTLRGHRLEPGDLVRVEEADPTEVLSIARLIDGELPRASRTVALYRYDPEIFSRYETDRLLPLYRAFD